jgi:hypothetical protein
MGADKGHHMFVINSYKKTIIADFHKEKMELQVRKEFPTEMSYIGKLEDRFLFHIGGELLFYDKNMNELGRPQLNERILFIKKKFPLESGDIVRLVEDKFILIAKGAYLYVADLDFTIIGKVRLIEGWKPGKRISGLAFHEGYVYVLDNIFTPYYVVKVDLKNPKKPKVAGRNSFGGVNTHLSGQWVDPDHDQWAILVNYVHRGGSGEFLRLLSMETCEETAKVDLFLSPKGKNKGRKLLGWCISESPSPKWAVIREYLEEGKEQEYLAKVILKKNDVAFKKAIEFDLPTKKFDFRDEPVKHDDHVSMSAFDDLIFVLTRSSFFLYVFSIKKSPKLLKKLSINDLGMKDY